MSKYTWCIDRYPVARVNGKQTRLHELIMGKAPNGLEWDHIDQNPLNNRRSNLRLTTHQVNIRNAKIPRNNTTGVKGVSYDPDRQRWQAGIKLNGKRIALGRYNTLEDAAAARKTGEALYWSIDAAKA